jgi:hypothetical protein
VRSERWLNVTVAAMAVVVLLLGILPAPVLNLAYRAGMASLVP